MVQVFLFFGRRFLFVVQKVKVMDGKNNFYLLIAKGEVVGVLVGAMPDIIAI